MLEQRGNIADFRLYHLNPSEAAAITFIILFSLTTLLHTYQIIRTQAWLFIPFWVGGLCKCNMIPPNILEALEIDLLTCHDKVEIVGYVGRVISAHQTPNWTLGPYIIQSVLLLVALALFAASIYMEFGQIVTLVDDNAHFFVRKTWLTKIFVLGYALLFLMHGSFALGIDNR